MVLTLFLLMLAFLIGYSIRRGSVCAVAAIQALVVDRRVARLRAFGVAAAGAGAVSVPLHWLYPSGATLSAGYPVTLQVILAGAAFGLGARINCACSLGTLAHLVGGNIRFAFTIVGMVTGAALMSFFNLAGSGMQMVQASPVETPSAGAIIFVLALLAVLVSALYRRVPRWLRHWHEPASLRMGPYRAMLLLGICGGVLYTLAGSWTYMSVLSDRAIRLVDPSQLATNGWPVLLCAVAVATGRVFSAVRTGGFKLTLPRGVETVRATTGGLIMGSAAALIPGGNGTLLLHGLPSLAPHALAAYASMMAVLALSYAVKR